MVLGKMESTLHGLSNVYDRMDWPVYVIRPRPNSTPLMLAKLFLKKVKKTRRATLRRSLHRMAQTLGDGVHGEKCHVWPVDGQLILPKDP